MDLAFVAGALATHPERVAWPSKRSADALGALGFPVSGN